MATFGSSGIVLSNIVTISNEFSLAAFVQQVLYTCPAGRYAEISINAYQSSINANTLSGAQDSNLKIIDGVNIYKLVNIALVSSNSNPSINIGFASYIGGNLDAGAGINIRSAPIILNSGASLAIGNPTLNTLSVQKIHAIIKEYILP